MDYEIVQLEEKTVAGLRTRTSNSDPDMTNIIGGLWRDFFEKGIFQAISGKKNGKSIGLYTNYESKVDGAYDVMVCCEVQTAAELPDGLQTVVIPAGRYAKFIVHGHMQRAVAEFWTELWSMKLDRKFSCDFEEYQNCEMENAEIHIYIALN